MGCNGRTFEELPSWLKLPCKSGLQWAAMGELLRNPPRLKFPYKSGLQWAAMGGLLRNYSWIKLQWAAMGELLRNYPPPWQKTAMKEWAAMSCNGRSFQELPPWLNSPCKGAAMGCNGRNFQELGPWLILPCKSGLQWDAMGGLFEELTSWLKFPCKSGLQWAAMGEILGNYPQTKIAI